jgi:hypothetical protein
MNNAITRTTASSDADNGLLNAARPRISAVTILAFIAGAANAYTVISLGEIYGSELVLPFAAALALVMRRDDGINWPRAGTLLLGAATAMLAGYILADLLGETSTHDYLRGWARALSVLISSGALLLMLTRAASSLWWYIIGTALGRFVHALMLGESIADPTGWKLQFSGPIAIIFSALSSALPSFVGNTLLVALGAYNFIRDFRSLGGIILVLAGLLWISRKQRLQRVSLSRWSVPTILSGAAVLLITSTLVGWYLSDNSKSDRQAISTLGRVAALRIGAEAIIANPVIGYGSWGQSTKGYADQLYDELSTSPQILEAGATDLISRESTFSPHSQLLQAWMEGGLLAASFFMTCLAGSIRAVYYLVTRRPKDYLTPIALFILLTGLWNILMSPFLGIHRLDIAVLVAMISFILNQETMTSKIISADRHSEYSKHEPPRRFNIID